jgi:hypothetical protein
MRQNISLEDLYNEGLNKETFSWIKENNLFNKILKIVKRQMILSFIERKKCFDQRSIMMKKARNAGISWETVNVLSFQISPRIPVSIKSFDRVFAEKLEIKIINYLFEKYAEKHNQVI